MRLASALALLSCAGCGDPLVGPMYLGAPVLELGGSVVQQGGRLPAEHGDVSLSLFWIKGGASAVPVEQRAVLGAGLASFSLTIFDAPPAAAAGFDRLLEGPGHLGLALLVLYADRNGSGRLEEAEDLVLGASARHLIAWSDMGIAGGSAAALLGERGQGYHLYEYDREGECTYALAERCAGVGALGWVPVDSKIVLRLWDDPGAVKVPAPAIDGGAASIWSP